MLAWHIFLYFVGHEKNRYVIKNCNFSHQDIVFITEHLFNLLDVSLPPLVSDDDPLHLLLPHLVYLPPHQQHHGHQVNTDQGLKLSKQNNNDGINHHLDFV